MPEPGTIIWNELLSADMAAARAYYTAVHGWSAMDTEMPGGGCYTVFLSGGRPVAGMMDIAVTSSPAGTPSHWFSYIAVEDARDAFRRAVENGATPVREPWEVPGAGVMAVLLAADGSAIGLMEPGEHWGKMKS